LANKLKTKGASGKAVRSTSRGATNNSVPQNRVRGSGTKDARPAKNMTTASYNAHGKVGRERRIGYDLATVTHGPGGSYAQMASFSSPRNFPSRLNDTASSVVGARNRQLVRAAVFTPLLLTNGGRADRHNIKYGKSVLKQNGYKITQTGRVKTVRHRTGGRRGTNWKKDSHGRFDGSY
jgi:hypothetical protein